MALTEKVYGPPLAIVALYAPVTGLVKIGLPGKPDMSRRAYRGQPVTLSVTLPEMA